MLTCTLLPSTCLTDSNPSIHLAVTEGVSTSIAWVADTELQGLITVVTELVWVNFLRGCKANAIGAAASRAADATVDLVTLGAVKRFDILDRHNSLGYSQGNSERIRGFSKLCIHLLYNPLMDFNFFPTRVKACVQSSGNPSRKSLKVIKKSDTLSGAAFLFFSFFLFLFFVWFSVYIFCFFGCVVGYF